MIKQFPKNYIRTEDIKIVSDWDNSYHLWSSWINEFNKDCQYITSLDDMSEEYYDACEEFDKKWGQFQI